MKRKSSSRARLRPLDPANSSQALGRRTGLPAPRPPQSLAELGEAEALLLRSLRHWIVGLHHGDHDAWSMAWSELASGLGIERARDALGALSALINGLCGHARRRIAYHQPCCHCLGPDEACLLALVTDCQQGNRDAAELRAAWLVGSAGLPAVIEAAEEIAANFAAKGFRLTRRPEARQQRSWDDEELVLVSMIEG